MTFFVYFKNYFMEANRGYEVTPGTRVSGVRVSVDVGRDDLTGDELVAVVGAVSGGVASAAKGIARIIANDTAHYENVFPDLEEGRDSKQTPDHLLFDQIEQELGLGSRVTMVNGLTYEVIDVYRTPADSWQTINKGQPAETRLHVTLQPVNDDELLSDDDLRQGALYLKLTPSIHNTPGVDVFGYSQSGTHYAPDCGHTRKHRTPEEVEANQGFFIKEVYTDGGAVKWFIKNLVDATKVSTAVAAGGNFSPIGKGADINVWKS